MSPNGVFVSSDAAKTLTQ